MGGSRRTTRSPRDKILLQNMRQINSGRGVSGYVTKRKHHRKNKPSTQVFQAPIFFFHIAFISDSKRLLSAHADPRSHTVCFSYLQQFFSPAIIQARPDRHLFCTQPRRAKPPGLAKLFQCPRHRSVPGEGEWRGLHSAGVCTPPATSLGSEPPLLQQRGAFLHQHRSPAPRAFSLGHPELQ